MLADHDHDFRPAYHQPLHPAERRAQEPRAAEREVRQLLGQARVHVVEVRHADHPRQDDTDKTTFFVRVDEVVAVREHTTHCGERQHDVERDLRHGRTDSDVGHKWRAEASEDTQSRQRHVAAEWIGDEVNRMAEIQKRTDPVVLAERRPPRLEKRLGGKHQDFHARGPGNRPDLLTAKEFWVYNDGFLKCLFLVSYRPRGA